VALLLAAANLRKIATFVQEQAAIEAGGNAATPSPASHHEGDRRLAT
jgi:hypothetical protein